MRRSPIVIPIVSLLLASSTCLAQLSWKETEVHLGLDSSASTGTATFEFVNESGSTVRIIEIKPGCGCTVPTLAKTEYVAGEAGQVTVKFAVGDRRGSYSVPIGVSYEGGGGDALTLSVEIRELVKLIPPQLVWAAGDKRTAKEVELHWLESDEVTISAIRSTNDAFKADLISEHDWHGARLRISPAGEDVKGVSVIVVTTAQGSDRRSRTYTVVARAL